MMVDRVKGVPAQLATPKSDADPLNPANSMTSSTPSLSASELAAWLDDYAREWRGLPMSVVGHPRDERPLRPKDAERLEHAASLLRRLAETERERDKAQKYATQQLSNAQDATNKATAAEAERDALREMLAQAAAFIERIGGANSAEGCDLLTALNEAKPSYQTKT